MISRYFLGNQAYHQKESEPATLAYSFDGIPGVSHQWLLKASAQRTVAFHNHGVIGIWGFDIL